MHKKYIGDKYDYSETVYLNKRTKLTIICKIHGEFEQLAQSHYKSGCRFCSNAKQRMTTETFINKANEIHNFKYNYSFVEYVNIDTKVKIICPEGHVMNQIPWSHLKGIGCNDCKKLSVENFVVKAQLKHGSNYDYSLVVNPVRKSNVKIICNSCSNIFEQDVGTHLRGHGCSICSKMGWSKSDFNRQCLQNNNRIRHFICYLLF